MSTLKSLSMLQEIATRVTGGCYLLLLRKRISKEKTSIERVDISVYFKFNGIMWEMKQWDYVWNGIDHSDIVLEKSDGSLEISFQNSGDMLIIDVFDKHLLKKVSLTFLNEINDDLLISISTFLYKKKNPLLFWKKLDFIIIYHSMNDENNDNENEINFILERIPEFLF